ncbi:hypothetical protein PR048_004610 [Dryococelus australis]|uniref:Uncharacterized protein n=1 Tax=Dryococelus australis TaxID=614101 RepID=A0ABQ9I7U0_9NEOP|nr:hypothetical protein PR048_004610 [Dryococelus australis]
MITKSGDRVWHCSSEFIVYIQNSITPLDCQRIKEYVTLSEDSEASRVGLGRRRRIAMSKYRNRILSERASQRQSSDTHKTQNDRVKRCRKRKKIIKASERVNVDVFTQNKRPFARPSVGHVIFNQSEGNFISILQPVKYISNLNFRQTDGWATALWSRWSPTAKKNLVRFSTASPVFSHVGNVADAAFGRWVFSGFSHFPYSCIPPLLHLFILAGTQDLTVNSRQNHFNVELLHRRTLRVSEVSMDQRRNERAEETRDPRENPSTNGIVRRENPDSEVDCLFMAAVGVRFSLELRRCRRKSCVRFTLKLLSPEHLQQEGHFCKFGYCSNPGAALPLTTDSTSPGGAQRTRPLRAGTAEVDIEPEPHRNSHPVVLLSQKWLSEHQTPRRPGSKPNPRSPPLPGRPSVYARHTAYVDHQGRRIQELVLRSWRARSAMFTLRGRAHLFPIYSLCSAGTRAVMSSEFCVCLSGVHCWLLYGPFILKWNLAKRSATLKAQAHFPSQTSVKVNLHVTNIPVDVGRGRKIENTMTISINKPVNKIIADDLVVENEIGHWPEACCGLIRSVIIEFRLLVRTEPVAPEPLIMLLSLCDPCEFTVNPRHYLQQQIISSPVSAILHTEVCHPCSEAVGGLGTPDIWNYLPSIVTNFTECMSLREPDKCMQVGAVTVFYG